MTKRLVWALALLLAGTFVAGVVWRSARTHAQQQPSNSATNGGANKLTDDSINEKAKKAQGGDERAVRELADEIFNTPYFAEMPDALRQTMKERVLRHEADYRKGKKGVKEEQVVLTVNRLADKFELPDYAKTGALQIRVLRARLRAGYPDFISQDAGRQSKGIKKKVGTRLKAEMSPLEAVFTTAVLLQQKLLNEDFQMAPGEYADNLHKKELEKWQAARAGKQVDDSQKHKLGFAEKNKYRELREAIGRKAAAMNMTDLLALPDETLDALGINR
jgi:hypothetical protein